MLRINRMIKGMIILIFVLCASSEIAVANDDVFITQPVYEFGNVKAGQVIDYVFQVKNQSQQNIEIDEVKPSCGCTTAGKWDKIVQPGALGNIPVKLDTANMHGEIDKGVRIYLKSSRNAPLLAHITGSVFLAIDVQPNQLRFPPLRDKNVIQTLDVHIFSNLEKPLDLKLDNKNQGLFYTDLKTIQKGKEFELVVKTQPGFQIGCNKEVIRLQTNSLEQPIVEVPVYCYVHKPFECRPGILTLPPGQLKHDIHKTVLFSINQPGGFKPPVISSELKTITIKYEPTKNEKEYRLEIQFPRGLLINNHGKATISIDIEALHGEKTMYTLPIEQLQEKR